MTGQSQAGALPPGTGVVLAGGGWQAVIRVAASSAAASIGSNQPVSVVSSVSSVAMISLSAEVTFWAL